VVVARSATGPQEVGGSALDGGITPMAAAVVEASWPLDALDSAGILVARRSMTWSVGNHPASSSGGASGSRGIRRSLGRPTGSGLEESLAILEQQLHMLEDRLEARLSNAGPPGEDGLCFANCQELGRRLQEVAATALECGCSRQVPGAMDVFEQANAMVERVGHLLQHCAPHHVKSTRQMAFDVRTDDTPAKQRHPRTSGGGVSGGTTRSDSDARNEGGFIGGLAHVGLSAAELFMSLLGAVVHGCCEWVLRYEATKRKGKGSTAEALAPHPVQPNSGV